jgi:diaminopimelate decarboxylase
LNTSKLERLLNLKDSKWHFLAEQEQSFFIYFEEELVQNVLRQKKTWQSMSAQSKIFYSVKSNPNLSVIRALAPHVDGFDISSKREFQLVHELAHISLDRITCSGPAKSDQFLNQLIEKNIHCIHVDNREEYQILQKTLAPRSLRICKEESFSQKVGLSDHDVSQIIRSAEYQELTGFHAYIGREQFSTEKISFMLKKMLRFAELNPKAFVENPEIFFGAGLSGSEDLDINSLKNSLPLNWPTSWTIHIEAGRAIAHSAGVYAARILSVKEQGGIKRVIIDGGLQHLATHFSSPRTGLALASTLCLRGSNVLEGETSLFNVCGSLSLWNDVLLSDFPLPQDIRRNDWILFHPCGSYGWTAASNQFIGPNPVREFIMNAGMITDASPQYLKTYLESFF